jgi:HEAT repeat protein
MIDIGVTGHSTLRLLVYQALKQYSTVALLPMLQDKSSIVRSAVARELQVRGEIDVFAHAKDLLQSEKGTDREIAAFLLGQLGTPDFPFRQQTVPLLEERLRLDADPSVREAAAAGLGHLAYVGSIPVLIEAADDASDCVRVSIAASLGRFRTDMRAIRALKKLANDADRAVRDWALFSLSE